MSSIGANHVGVVGAGTIGISFAIVFARAGHTVSVYDIVEESRSTGSARVLERLALLNDFDLLTEAEETISNRITFDADLSSTVKNASLVLECAQEDLDVKRAIFSELESLAPDHAILASASSALRASEFAGHLATRARCLVLHPANPPYLLPVVEVVPAPFTTEETVARAESILANAGMEGVRIDAELTGFVYNRLQGALLREAYCLVRDGVVDVAGIDTIVRDALGLRWSVIGPFETIDLNTRGGIEAHAARLGAAYERMGRERGQYDPWTPDLVARVASQRRQMLPLKDWADRVLWRDRQLAALQSWRQQNLEPTVHVGEDPRAAPQRR